MSSLKLSFFAFTIAVFCAVWPDMEQPAVQLAVFQVGGILFLAVAGCFENLRKPPREQAFVVFLVALSLVLHRNTGSFLGMGQAFFASILYLTIASKIEKRWIVDALFISAIVQIPVSIGQLFGYDPIFQYRLGPSIPHLARQATGFIGRRSELCIFLATVSMLKLEADDHLKGLFLNVCVFLFKGIAGMGGIMASWLAWAWKKSRYVFCAVLLASLCVLAPQAGEIMRTKSAIRLNVWKPFLNASFSRIYDGQGMLSSGPAIREFVTDSTGVHWTEIKNSYLTLWFEMGLIGAGIVWFLLKRGFSLFRLERIPTSGYAFLVMVFSSLFVTTHLYPSLAYLWILVLSLVHIDSIERGATDFEGRRGHEA